MNDNNIDSNNEGIDVYNLLDLGTYMYDDSIFTMGDIQFNGNTINSSGYGIHVEYMQNFGYEMEGASSFTMGHIELRGNIINSGNDGIHVDHIDNFGNYMEENSTFTMGNIEFSENIINSTYHGIWTIDLAYQFARALGANITLGKLGNTRFANIEFAETFADEPLSSFYRFSANWAVVSSYIVSYYLVCGF